MNIDQLYVALVYVLSELSKHAHIVVGGFLAMTISILKTAKEGRKQNISESILCGIFAAIALTGVGIITHLATLVFNIPEGVSIPPEFVTGFVGGLLGWYGTDRTIELLKGMKKGKNNEDDR